MNPCLSVIIPVFNETECINRFIRHLCSFTFTGGFEIIVVDGNPNANTINEIEDAGRTITVKKVLSPKGRGIQMNTGTFQAQGTILLFLHADTILAQDAFQAIESVMSKKKDIVGGAFDLGIHSEKISFRIIEKASSLRSRITRIPYGDQAIFIKTDYFKKIGGFAPLPIMEDVELMDRIKRKGGKIHIIPKKVQTSPRRWENEGILFCTLRNWFLITLYFFGVSANTLARFYQKK